jgi:predicted secreted protein
MATLSGNDVTLYKRTATAPDVWKPVVCSLAATLNNSREVITSKTKCGTTSKQGTRSWSIDLEFEAKTDPGTDAISHDVMYDDFDTDGTHHYAFKNDDNSFGFEGDGVVTKFDIGAPVDDTVKVTITISGNGDLVKMSAAATCPTFTITPHTTTIDVSFTSDSVADQYRAQIFSNSGGTTQVGTNHDITGSTPGTPQTLSYTFTGLTASTNYWIRISPMVGGAVSQTCGLVATATTA